jgi:hypothetical protein
MIEFKEHEDALEADKNPILLIEERPNKTIVIGAPHHAPGGKKELPCPEHTDSDENTGQIAHDLADRLQVSAIIACNAAVDPNKSLTTEYSTRIIQWKPGFLIEIHGHGGKAVPEDVIEVSCGTLSNNAWSIGFAKVFQSYLNTIDALKMFKVSGDFEKLHFKASKTATVTNPDWISFHIELPPALRIGTGNGLPEMTDVFLAALEKTIRFVCISKTFDIQSSGDS